MARQSGPGGRHGQKGPVFNEIIWLRRWPRLVSTCFIILILLEILVFVWVADHIGLGLTLLVLIGSAFIGLWLIRRTGLDMVGRLRLSLAQGQEPGHSLIYGACYVVAGLLLILPGFFSDFLALLLMLPMTRNWLIRYFAGKMVGAGATGTSGGPRIISDVEFHEVVTRPAVKESSAKGTSGKSAPATRMPASPADTPTTEPASGAGTETTTAPADTPAAEPVVEPEILAPIRPTSPAPSAPPSGEEGNTGDGPSEGDTTVPEDERWGQVRRRPIIDVEES